jgi:hypothetical protein
MIECRVKKFEEFHTCMVNLFLYPENKKVYINKDYLYNKLIKFMRLRDRERENKIRENKIGWDLLLIRQFMEA